MTDCIIFDLDGTLVDSEPLGIQAMLELVPGLEFSAEEMLHRYRGRRLAEIFAEFEVITGKPLPADFETVYRARVEEIFATSLKAFPGVHEALDGIETEICIASNAPMRKIRSALNKTGLERFFGDRVFSAYEIGRWKPDPGIFLHAAESMRARAEACLVIEDSPAGIAAARAAGMTPLHFRGSGPDVDGVDGFRSYDRFLEEVTRIKQQTARSGAA